MAQGHRFESEWPSEALSGARRSHSGRFGVVHQAVVDGRHLHSCRRLTAGRGVGKNILPRRSSWTSRPASTTPGPGCRAGSHYRSHVRDRLRAAILQRPPKGDGDKMVLRNG